MVVSFQSQNPLISSSFIAYVERCPSRTVDLDLHARNVSVLRKCGYGSSSPKMVFLLDENLLSSSFIAYCFCPCRTVGLDLHARNVSVLRNAHNASTDIIDRDLGSEARVYFISEAWDHVHYMWYVGQVSRRKLVLARLRVDHILKLVSERLREDRFPKLGSWEWSPGSYFIWGLD